MIFNTEAEAITYIFGSMRKLRGIERGLDEVSRDVSPTIALIQAAGLLNARREYAVVTGSKGKGSTTVMTAKLLQHLGHRTGTLTSPHLVTWRERIRVNGRAIPEADFLRILSELSPEIDRIEAGIQEGHYFSPQGIFLAIALRHFDEQNVAAAVLEVGRGGRYDDVAVVHNKLSLFTPIMLEHTSYLGPTLERIAWHKAGIMTPGTYAYSVAQAPEVLRVLEQEAEAKGVEFSWIAPMDEAEYLGPAENGIRLRLGRYGEMILPLLGRYQTTNATLAITAAGNMHARLPGVSHGSADYVNAIRSGIAAVQWPGRAQKLQDHPAVYIDGAINAESATSFVESLRDRLRDPVIGIACVPDDKDYAGVYRALAAVCQALILADTPRNPSLHFLDAETAINAARTCLDDVTHAPTVREAVDLALRRAGQAGTVLMAGTQSMLADAMDLWGLTFEQI